MYCENENCQGYVKIYFKYNTCEGATDLHATCRHCYRNMYMYDQSCGCKKVDITKQEYMSLLSKHGGKRFYRY